MDGPAPAILNAIEHATGIAFNQIPLLPEDIFERMRSLREDRNDSPASVVDIAAPLSSTAVQG
jgi:hypothetical protein